MTRCLALLALLAALLPFAAIAEPLAGVPLIPREMLFGNPVKAAPQISPDGKWLSWLAPRDGVMNVWVAPASALTKARAMTSERVRPIRQYFWAPDSRQILFVNDKGGDENFLLYGVDLASGVERLLTPFEKTRVGVLGVSPLVLDHILISANNRDAKWNDVLSLNLASGELTPVLLNTGGYDGFMADRKLTVRAALKTRPDGSSNYFAVSNNRVSSAVSETIAVTDGLTTRQAGYTSDGKTLYWIDSRDRNTAALIAQDVATGARTVIAENTKADIGGALAHPRTGEIEAYSANYLKDEWTALNPTVAADLAFLESKLPGEFVVTSRTLADDKWTVAVASSIAPASSWLYDRKARTVTKLFSSRPALEGQPLSRMHPVEIKSRDGMTLVSYLTLPPGSDPEGDGRPSAAVPMVLLVHGGPWARDAYGFNSTHQWLANRGYAVLSTNYRSSTGFGKNFINAGNLQWGRAMHDDLLDAVAWAVKTGVTSADKVAIMGGSYGGYATLTGLTLTPDKFACGVDIVGPSNLVTMFNSFPPYWQAVRTSFAMRMGNPATTEGNAMLLDRSPITHVDKIKRPLLIGQGGNDPRIVKAESDQIVAAMKAKNIPVTYVLFPDEGHGFARPANNIAFSAVAENFLGQCLGGRAEEIGGTIRASTAEVPHGAEYAPGLAAALKR